MSQKKKLIKRLLNKPSDFTFDEAVTLLRYLGYRIDHKGKTSGSRVEFVSDDNSRVFLHKPHPDNNLKKYQIKQLIETLNKEDLI